MKTWTATAIRKIEADYNRSSDTHLIPLEIPATPNIQLYFKDESTHPTGSLKHRLARSLFLYGLCNGWITEHTPIIEASSGSTAVSEAYFARLLGLRFIAVMPSGTSIEKINAIKFYGGECHLIDDTALIYNEAHRLACELKGHYVDQFTYAERATDWRGSNNIADTVFEQMKLEPNPEPAWIVCGAGTGGTSATFGRYVRYQHYATKICVVDPENSVFYDSFYSGSREHRCEGGSGGTNLFGVFELMNEMRQSQQSGSVVTLICDDGNRYQNTYFDHDWLRDNGHDIAPWVAMYQRFFERGEWVLPQ